MKKILVFFGWFSLAAFIIFFIIIGFNWTAFKAVFTDREAFAEGAEWVEKTYSLAGLVEFIEANPHHVSIVSLNVNDPDDRLLLKEDEMRVLGATGNILLIMEYARQVHEGMLEPEERINLDDIARFRVPGWYGNQFRNAARNLNPVDNTVSLEETIILVSRHYSQAASDWLFFKLGPENVQNLIDSLGNGSIEPWIPASGIKLAMINRDSGLSKQDLVQQLRDMPVKERAEILTEYAHTYKTDDEFRSVIQKTAPRLRDRKLTEERMIHGLWTKAEPLVFTEILKQLYRGEFINEEVSEYVISFMAWAHEDPIVRQHTQDYSAIFENRLGYLSAADMGTSVYTNQSYVQTVFFYDLPIAFWLHMSSNHMNHDFQRRLIYDPELRRITAEAAKAATETIQ